MTSKDSKQPANTATPALSAKRMRVIGWIVQPVVMADDGENLTPIPVEPIQVSTSRWDEFKNGGDVESLASLRSQIEA